MKSDEIVQYARDHLPDYLQTRGISTTRAFRCLNPAHPDKHPSMSYDKSSNKVHCFSCRATYDTLDLIGIDQGLTDFPAKIRAAADFFNLSLDGAGEKPRRPAGAGARNAQPPRQPERKNEPEPEADYSAFIEQASRDLEKLGEIQTSGSYRGIPVDTLQRFNIGYVENYKGWNALVIPTGTGKNAYVLRNLDKNAPHEKRYKAATGTSRQLFNAAALYDPGWKWPVFIVEGEIDALSVSAARAEAVGLGGTNNTGLLLDLLREKPPAQPLILALDNDRAGEQAREELINGTGGKPGLKQLDIPFYVVNIAGEYKDPNESLTEEGIGNFARAIASAIDTVTEQRKREAEERQRRTGEGMIDSFLDEIRSRKYEPIPTGITDIDTALGGGFIRQQLILLGAAPGTGKTALAQWIFEGMAKRGSASCLYLNLEMSREQILARSLSRILAEKGHTIKPTQILQGYKWNFAEEDAILKAAAEYKKTIAQRMIYNPEGITANLDTILEYIRKEAGAATKAGLPAPCVVLDYLQIVTGSAREDDAAIIKRAVAELKRIAVEYNTVVFVIIAHNREANKSGTVSMTSGRDTSALEYSADLQLGLAFTLCMNRPGQTAKNPDELTQEERQQLTLKVTKGRFATPGTEVNLLFSGETMTYTQLTKIGQGQPEPPRPGSRYRV